MHISRFQLKLTLLFLLILLAPTAIVTFLAIKFTVETTGMDADQRVETVLLEASGIVEDMVDEAKAECQSIAEGLSADEEFATAFESEDELGSIVSEILTIGDALLVAAFDFRADIGKGEIRFSTSADAENVPDLVISNLKQDGESQSYQEGGVVYGISPILEGDSLIGAVVVQQELEQELVEKYMDLRNLLQIYAIRPDFQSWVWSGIITVFVILALIGAALGWLISRSVTKPILSLVAGTREIARGDLDHKVEVKGRDEIAVLIESFNSMTSQLKSSREREVRAERLAAWRDVARRIAHEIKNPLTPIQLSMYRLRKNLGDDKYDDIFQQAYTSITNEVENLRNMVTEFSDFARMPKPRTQPSDPGEIVQNALDLYTGLPDSITLHTELVDDLPRVIADSDQIRQVLHNLIGNAVDAMPDGGRLSVTTRQEADDVIIEISDTGCGMSEEVMQKIFTPYFTTKGTGTGLGMAITAQIIEEHGGEISVESEEDVGTTVIVKLSGMTDSIA
jgi:nitrogen fixation/metabolism regulation signal transduction histidine kinase